VASWTPAPDQRCCGTCAHLCRKDEELTCAKDVVAWVGTTWWGTACTEYERRPEPAEGRTP
jgi:hypothetical protein